MKKFALVLIVLCLLLIAGCAAPQNTGGYQKITPEEAKAMLDAGKDLTLVDVRTQEEYDQGHIPGAMLLPSTDIQEKAAQALPDKSAVLLVYCRSGARSSSASKALAAMGYTNVYDLGGIASWPYETTTEPNQ